MVSQIPKETCPRPFLKWAGGKSRLIPQYLSHLPKNYRTYHEPFLGGGALFFYLQPTKSILTDINSELITTYRCVRDRIEELISLLREHKSQHNKDYYYSIRGKTVDNELEQAARFIYLNKTCYNGLYRVNSQGRFNVPLGKYNNPNICQEDLLRATSNALSTSEIKQADFTEVLNYATGGDDFVFFDPPYYPISNTSYFTGYSKNSFGEKDQLILRNTCVDLASRGVKVVICNSDCEFIKNIYQEIGFNIYSIEAKRSINSNIKKRGLVKEVLITSY